MKYIYINILTLCQLIISSNSKQHEARVWLMPKPLMYSSNIWKACTFSFFFVRAHSFQIKFLFLCLFQDLYCEENSPILHMHEGPHQQQFHMDFIIILLALPTKARMLCSDSL